MILGSCQRLGALPSLGRIVETSPGPDGHTHRVDLGARGIGRMRGMGYIATDLGPEGLLVDAEGNPIDDTRRRLDLALRYISNWYRATDDSDNKSIWWAKIDDVRAKVEAAFTSMDPSKVFPGKDELALYHDAQAAFPEMWRQLNFSADTLPRPELIDIAADFLDAVTETPGIIVTTVIDKLTKGAGDAVGKAVKNLWPVLLVAGVLGGGYLVVKAKVLK